MGKSRSTGDLTAENLISVDISNDRIGINSTSPTKRLDVGGDINFSGSLYQNGSLYTGDGLTGIKSDSTSIASGVVIDTLDFTGSGITSVSYDAGTTTATIHIKGAERRGQTFTAGAAQTGFTVTGGYTAGYVDVYLNGSKLQETAEFTATDGSEVVLQEGALSGDILDVVGFKLNVDYNPNYVTTRATTRSVATADQTTFNVSYNVGYIDVFLNGSKLDSTEFTADTGSTVVLSEGAAAGDVLEFVSYVALSISTTDTTVVNETTNATRYITFTEATSGSISTARISSSNLTFNPSTGALTATSVTGNLTGNVTGNVTGNLTGNVTGTATTATTATNITVADESSDTTCFPIFTTTATGDQALKTDSSALTYNASNGTLYATKFSGDGSALTGINATDITLDAMLFGGV